MKKLIYLVTLALILGLVLTGCSLLSNVGQVPTTGQKGMPSSDADLLALWHFDEDSGAITYDSTANSNDGTVSGASWVDGKLGKALSFDGTDDYVQIANESNFDFEMTDALTLEAWVKTSSDAILCIITKMHNASPTTGYQLIKHGNSYGNKLYFFLVNDNGSGNMIRAYGSTDITDGQWHHVAVTYDGSCDVSGVQIYVDGIPETMGYSDNALTGSILNDLPLQISGREGNNYAFNGIIDEVRIWDGALTATEIEYSFADETLHVDDDGAQWPGAYYTINEALAVAGDGDTIIVHAGIYTDDIFDGSLIDNDRYRIKKSVTLLGAQAGNDPAGSTDRIGETILVRTNGTPYSLYVSGITIDGFTFKSGGGSGGGRLVIADAADDVTIKNCIIKDISGTDPHGVYIYPGAQNALVEYNTFSNTAWEAIRCDGNAMISNNTIKDIPSNKGIFLGGAGGAQVIDNVITNTFYEGIQAYAQTTITGNEISGCYKGIQIQASAGGSTIIGNTISVTTYEGIQAYAQTTIKDNEISGCYKGIQIQASAGGSTIIGNTISVTTYEGIQAYAPVTITGNDISGCFHGIQIRNHATGTVIEWNNIYDNTYHGIEIPNYDNGEPVVIGATITNNTFANNGYTGIKVGGGTDGSGININYNGFEGNGIFGVESEVKTEGSFVDATRNWWGHASGPSGEYGRVNKQGKVIGKGDAVSDYVNWDPWLSQPTVPPTQILNKWDLKGSFVAHTGYNWGIPVTDPVEDTTWEYSIHIKEATNGDFSVGSIHFSTGDIEVTGIVEQTKSDYAYWSTPNLAAAGRAEYDGVMYNFLFLYNVNKMWFALSEEDLEPSWSQETAWGARAYQLHSKVPDESFIMDPKYIH